ncbi:MAG: SDR family oxidoreductase [Rhodospirillaceae bacterium]|nr:SDR family oxidoreductase [Rhodospirillaceae bacterium]MBT6136460.1 SDR family oxidoreductase [Rhodospirillaceae bacterium]
MSDAGITAGDFDFTGKRVLITGAAGGIGEAMAEAFAAQGATIVAADRNVDGMAALGDRIAVADQIAYDQADASSISEMVERAGDIDILLNNAGILWVGQFEDMPDDEIEAVMLTNLVGPIRVARLVGPNMIARGGGVILNTSSQLAFHGSAGRAVYATAKAGLTQFTKSIASEWAGRGVRVLAIGPGRTLTPLTAHILADENVRIEGLKHIPAGRYGEAREMARLAVVLASGVADYIHGETVVADGGYVLL